MPVKWKVPNVVAEGVPLEEEVQSLQLPTSDARITPPKRSEKQKDEMKPGDFVVTRYTDKYSPILQQFAIGGKQLGDIEVTFTSESGSFVVSFKNCLIASMNISSDRAGGKNYDMLTINFEDMKIVPR